MRSVTFAAAKLIRLFFEDTQITKLMFIQPQTRRSKPRIIINFGVARMKKPYTPRGPGTEFLRP